MGSFAELYKREGAYISDKKAEEFKERIEKLYQAGGMMEVERVKLFGKELTTIRKATMHDCGMNFNYNYFEDSVWENAGFSTEHNCIWSGKIGWGYFARAVLAAYTLEALYTEGETLITTDGEPVSSSLYTGWINYLFQEKFGIKNNNPWKAFEVANKEELNIKEDEWIYFVKDEKGMKNYFEVYAVLHGTEEAVKLFKSMYKEEGSEANKKESEIPHLSISETLKNDMLMYKKKSRLEEAEQISLFTEMLHSCYEKKQKLSEDEKANDEELEKIQIYMKFSGAPVFIIKTIAEVYEKDFWELWSQLKNELWLQNAVSGVQNGVVQPITTMKVFRQIPDDMIPFWNEESDIYFSEEQIEWFYSLREEFKSMIETGFSVEKPLNWIMELMEYASQEFFRIFTFTDFFEETCANLSDIRYLILWKIYENMLHDPELEKAGAVIYFNDEQENGENDSECSDIKKQRRLVSSWDFMGQEKKYNKARVTFRRYMALVANKPLRKIVFGF